MCIFRGKTLSAEEGATPALLAACFPPQALAFSLFSPPKLNPCTLMYSSELPWHKYSGGFLPKSVQQAEAEATENRRLASRSAGSATLAAGICLLLVLLELAKPAACCHGESMEMERAREEAGADLGWEEASSCCGTAPWSEQQREMSQLCGERGCLQPCFWFLELCSHQNPAPRGAGQTQDKILPMNTMRVLSVN